MTEREKDDLLNALTSAVLALLVDAAKRADREKRPEDARELYACANLLIRTRVR